MSIQSVVLPVFVEVLLVFVLLGMMARSRMAALGQGLAKSDIALDPEAFPPRARQFANAYNNQFEMPVLFFVAVVLGIQLRQAGTLFVCLEWLFVAARIAQAGVHVTTNDVGLRGPLFLLGALSVLCLWVLLFVGITLGTP
jgi:hypothetical protein